MSGSSSELAAGPDDKAAPTLKRRKSSDPFASGAGGNGSGTGTTGATQTELVFGPAGSGVGLSLGLPNTHASQRPRTAAGVSGSSHVSAAVVGGVGIGSPLSGRVATGTTGSKSAGLPAEVQILAFEHMYVPSTCP